MKISLGDDSKCGYLHTSLGPDKGGWADLIPSSCKLVVHLWSN